MKVVLADVEERRLAETAGPRAAAGVDVLAVAPTSPTAPHVEALAERAYAALGARARALQQRRRRRGGGPMREPRTDDWQWVLGVNLWGVIHGIRRFVPRMLEQGEEGHIVNTASMAGLIAAPGPRRLQRDQVRGRRALRDAPKDLPAAPIGVSVLCPMGVSHARSAPPTGTVRPRPTETHATATQA